MEKTKRVCSYFLVFLLFLSLLSGTSMYLVNREMQRFPDLSEVIIDDEYMEQMQTSVLFRLRSKMALTALTLGDIEDLFQKDAIRSAAQEALKSTLYAASGRETEAYQYENNALLLRIDEILTQFAAEHSLIYEKGAPEQVYDMLCSCVQDELTVLSDSYTKRISPLFVKLQRITQYWFLPFAAAFLLALLLLLPNRKNPGRYAVSVCTSAYFSGFLIFIFIYVLYRRDLLARTILTDSILQHLLRRIYLVLLGNMWRTALFAALVPAAALLILLVLFVRKQLELNYKKESVAK